MSESRLVDYLEHILEAARLACEYTEGLDKKIFLPTGEPSRPSS